MDNTKHHRRPRSRGGDGEDENISIVPRKEHEAWHTLFNHMDAEGICRRFNGIYLDPQVEFYCANHRGSGLPFSCGEETPNRVPRDEKDVRHYRKPISRGGRENPENISFIPQNQLDAWHILFKDYDSDAICQIVNEVWLDYRFKFFCRPKGKK